MIKEGTFLKFIPPTLSGGNSRDNKARYMLVIENNLNDNFIKMINVSSTKNKEHKLLYDSNISIQNYSPLPVPSFAKLDTLYIIDYFNELENFIAFDSQTLIPEQLDIIKKKRLDYILNKKSSVIQFTENEFKKYNKNSEVI